MNFSTLKKALASRFTELAQGKLFVLDVPQEALWATYLFGFTDDPIFKTRRTHDCSCCRHFIRDIGPVVALVDGKIESIWDIKVPEYQSVVDQMAALARAYPIKDVFFAPQASMGNKTNYAQIDGVQHTFEHFQVEVPRKHVLPQRDIASKQGDLRTSAQVLKTTITDAISPESVSQVLEMISSNSIYRGQEFEASIKEFQKLQKKYLSNGVGPDLFAWEHYDSHVARIKNTSIGTLLVDLTEGKDIEDAVKSYEKKVAPENYKRPTALVTPKMIEQAKDKVRDLGLLDAMSRRYAALEDISINNVLYADRTAKKRMKDAFDDLAGSQAINPKSFDRVDEIGIEKFVSDVLPTATTLEVLFENSQVGNLVSLVTEAHPNSAKLFKWDNPFSWSYNGDMTDSIKERVKAAGGNVTGEVCCRLAWNNFDDLDFHMLEPGGAHIYYATRHGISPNGGKLDVDANAGGGGTRTPVENIFYARRSTMRDGEYRLAVNQFCRRENADSGFTVEIDINGDITTFEAPNNPLTNKTVEVATLVVKNGQVSVTPHMKSSSVSRTEWGIATGQFHRVNAVMFSPNHWEGERGIGNKHYLFMLAECVNEGNARGFYNEFLRGELDPHRKVLEMIGSRQRTEETPNQLSGLGFSSTKKQTLIVRVTGQVSRVLKVVF